MSEIRVRVHGSFRTLFKERMKQWLEAGEDRGRS